MSPLTLSLLLLTLIASTKHEVQIATIVPTDSSWMFNKDRVSPAIEYAFAKIRKDGILSMDVNVRYADSQCNSAAAPLAAFNFFRYNQAHVFFGPVCDYSLAPVARYSPFWDIPVISPGGMAHDFGVDKLKEFPMLTRVGWTFDSLATQIDAMIETHQWRSLKVLYTPFGHNKVAERFCYLAMSALIRHLRLQQRREYHVYNFDDSKGAEEYQKMLNEEVGTKYAVTSEATAGTMATALIDSMTILWLMSCILTTAFGDLFKLGVILPFKGQAEPWALPRGTKAGISYAVESINENRRNILPKHSFQVTYGDSQCSDTYGPLVAIDMYLNKSAHVFLGPACDYAVAPIARFSPHWNIPVITGGALVQAFVDKKDQYMLLTRIGGTYEKLGAFFVSLFQEFGWHRPGFLYHNNLAERSTLGKSNCYFIMESVYLVMNGYYQKTSSYREKLWVEAFDEVKGFNKSLVMKEVSNNARIVVLCASPDSVREIMIKARELNFHNGEYVFFNIDLFSSKNEIEKPWFRANDTDDRNNKAREAYEALMTVTLRKPESEAYKNFSEEVKRRARQEYGHFVYGDEEVNSFVGAFHDAVILYALALNETLEAGQSASNGTEITKRMWNRTFEGITGVVSIDENGDRNADYSLLDMNPDNGKFEVVANYFGSKKKYEAVPGKSIHWAGGRESAPPDTPECGFDRSGCPPEEPFPEYGIVIIVLGSLLIIVSIAAFFVYRHYKLEAELAEVNWRVRWDDILFSAQERKKLERSASRFSINRRLSFQSNVSTDSIAAHLSDCGRQQIFTKTGFYKGTLVAIKKIYRNSINVTRPLQMEFKRMRDLQNEHIVRFIGVCIDAPNHCILTEYCQKGSLQDVLENEQLKLDKMFKFSLMQDIVRGMSYIHNSEIRIHGNLKSSNCVVDSRFVLKITDFGLRSLRSQGLPREEENFSYYQSKLWTAPELLRHPGSQLEGTQKGDVYSFAIICQEIVYRKGPFWVQGKDETSPQEIYRLVKEGIRPLYRPTLMEGDDSNDCITDDLASMIRKCWDEDPMNRQDFSALKTTIRKINTDGDTGNILDNLLKRMEMYANNLESLVEERTADYLEQKKRAEDLLYNMLPRSVAVQLMQGQTVPASQFDCVTIYFSDICGFTSLSADSTPMQVVTLLNDLYTTFDSIIGTFDVYKVETIGDAYMVVSGLPQINGDRHACEICRMALALLNAVRSFKIRHMPDRQLRLRIGIHSGPVCAGVVGLKMPRYCLFGDTVNTASRMESNGEPLKIHLSPDTKPLLEKLGSFYFTYRGPVEMKGKGVVNTWWLDGEDNPNHPDLAPKYQETQT